MTSGLTCETQRNTRGTLRCDCQKETGCLLPCTARTQSLWPGSAATHKSKPLGLRWSFSLQLLINVVQQLTSQSNLMCLANVVWISVREQLSLPLEMSIRSWREYMSSFSTKCCRSWSCGQSKPVMSHVFIHFLNLLVPELRVT